MIENSTNDIHCPVGQELIDIAMLDIVFIKALKHSLGNIINGLWLVPALKIGNELKRHKRMLDLYYNNKKTRRTGNR